MRRKQKIGKSEKKAVMILAALAVLIMLRIQIGGGSVNSVVRVMYTEKSGWRSWTARYHRLNGYMRHVIHPKQSPDVLRVIVETKKGSLSIQISDADGNVLFDEKDIGKNSKDDLVPDAKKDMAQDTQTDTFDINVPGKVTVVIRAKDHQGRFEIRSIQQ